MRLDALPSSIRAWIASDLVFATAGGLERPADLEDSRLEHVHAHEREVGLGLGRLLLELNDAFSVEFGDAEGARIVDVLEEDQRIRLPVFELLHHRLDAVAEEVVAQVDLAEGRDPDRVLGGEHCVREAERLLLDDVADPEPQREPSPARSRISWPASPGEMTIVMSSIPASRIASIP